MPFAPFVGVNHHGHSILLGCGLISSEDTNTFVWLFRTWLACMGGVAPQGIITDQDRAMKNAIQLVFPTTNHRLCLWHIMKKLPEKFGSHAEYENISRLIHEAIYDSQSINDFEGVWRTLIEIYHLEGNAWLSSLYLDRAMWVPIFVKKYFWAGMSTMQRSESMNSFFDGYVNSKTTLKQFVEQYENALRKKVEKECQADFESFNKQIPCATFYDMEKQIRNIYTAGKFIEFQTELTGMMYCGIKNVIGSDSTKQYIVYEDVVYGESGKKKVLFNVSYEGLEVSCSCLRFEFRGILCRHAITVLISNDRYELPTQYIFNRWRKDVRRSHSRVKISCDGWTLSPEQRRYDDMCKSFTKLADLAADDEVYYLNVMQWIDASSRTMAPNATPVLIRGSCNSNDPITKRGKGRPCSVIKKKTYRRKRNGSCSTSAGASVTQEDEEHSQAL
ncbi:protein FAR1-RELATED SEQUENCE 5-like [Tripterygium wilfordii]|uniref:protein FAR1-RELATED SEQUENCE 5-like n=1 Tax=Tripterygium wilfordii TaxID=458696 RepID=UPI0018F8295A|nr:protein FAR1-RELATED SEQUENCE 5-like [Tripterygium wilfordii]